MIAAQPNKAQQEKLIAKLMELPNNAVRVVFVYNIMILMSPTYSGIR